MTDREHSVDVIGAFPKEPEDKELAVIEDLVKRYGRTILEYVRLTRERRSEKKAPVFWDVFECAALTRHSRHQLIEVKSTE